jgi:type I restriction enzyme R subunit
LIPNKKAALLDEFGYPPVDKDEVYVEIFEQAENFKKYN